jgi:trk system potassium uptake protein TrkH
MTAMALMFIGGSTGSTAGGIKNATAGILFLSAVNSMFGKKRLTVFDRTISDRQILTALSIMIMALGICFTGSAAIAIIQRDIPFTNILFESISAISICGLSHGITPGLTPVSICILVLLMIFGRIGIMTAGMAAFINRNVTDKTKRPEAWILMG